MRPQGSEATNHDPDVANAELYNETVWKVFEKLGIKWTVFEEHLVAVVSDGAGTRGAYVDWLNVVREKARMEVIAWVKGAAQCVMRAIGTAKGSVKVWYDALDDLVSFLACFYRTSSKRIRGLWRKDGKFCFSRCTGVRWVEAMFHELDIVPENLPTVLVYLFKCINNEVDLGRSREKAEGLLDALVHPLFKFTAAFFFAIFLLWFVPQARKKQASRGARVSAVQGLMNVVCMPLLHTTRHAIPRGWEESLGVKVGSSLIKGSRMKFLRALFQYAQTRFNGSQWVGSATVEDWVEASLCSCERVFGYMTAPDFAQSTERMCETLWIRCNREALENWGSFEVFDELRKTPF